VLFAATREATMAAFAKSGGSEPVPAFGVKADILDSATLGQLSAFDPLRTLSGPLLLRCSAVDPLYAARSLGWGAQ
jgi:hypothetical protein